MEALCRGFELLPDGAIESLNEWSFDRFDAAIIEDGDPLYVQYDVLPVNLGAKWGQLTESDWTTFSCQKKGE
jgi:hypothetical protein